MVDTSSGDTIFIAPGDMELIKSLAQKPNEKPDDKRDDMTILKQFIEGQASENMTHASAMLLKLLNGSV